MLSADVTAQWLRASEQFIALVALELVLRLTRGFNQIEVAFDLYSSVSSLWWGHVWGWGLCRRLVIAISILQLQRDLTFDVFRILVAALVIALFSHCLLLILDLIFEPLVLLLEEWPEAKSILDQLVCSSDLLIALAVCRSLLSTLESVYLTCIRSVPRRGLGTWLIWRLRLDAWLWWRLQLAIALPHRKGLRLSVVVPDEVGQ